MPPVGTPTGGSQAPRTQRWKAPEGWCRAPLLSELSPCCITHLLCSSVCNLGWGTRGQEPWRWDRAFPGSVPVFGRRRLWLASQ